MYNSQLKVLACVADCGSFTKAAEKLFISPTAVMKQVNTLEEHLGVKLLKRTPRGVFLTEAGRSIYDDACRLFAFSREAVTKAQRLAEKGQTTFRVGTSMLNPCTYFMDLWRKINPDFPQYALRIVPFEDSRAGILSEIAALGQKFDFLVAACSSEAWLSRCNFHRLGEYKMSCAVPQGHGLSGKKRLTVTDLYGECLLLGARGDSPSVDALRDALEQHPQITLEDTSCFYDIDVFNLCEKDKKILLTLDCWKDIHPSLVTLPVQWDFTVPHGILYPLQPSVGVTAFLDVLKTFPLPTVPGAGKKSRSN